MKLATCAFLALAMMCVILLPAAAQTPAAGDAAPAPVNLGAAELQTLVAPIALYPDALIAHILPASTAEIDVVQAARFLRKNNGKATPKPDEKWNTSVFVLLQFPDVLYRMDENLDWTEKLGNAVIAQQADVMKAIQAVRTAATSNGALHSNDKQTVVVEYDTVKILPSNPQVVYVPTYNPEVVVVNQTNTGQTAAAAAVGFGAGVAVGALLKDDHCDWHGGYVAHGSYPVHYGTYAHPVTPYGAAGVGRVGVGGQAGVGGGAAGAAGVGRGAAGAGRAGAGGQAGVGGGAAGAAGAGRGEAGVGRAGAGGQAGAGGGAAGAAGAGRGSAGAGRAGAGGQAGAGGGAAGAAGAGRGSAGAGPFGSMSSRFGAGRSSSRGHGSLGGGRSGGRGGRR